MTSTVNENDTTESNNIIDFRRDWKFINLVNQNPEANYTTIDYNDSDWLSITLPHYTTKQNSSIYWYRKQFQWKHKADRLQHVYLNFSSIRYENKASNSHRVSGIILWLNEELIFTGTFPKQSIDLTSHLKMNSSNILAMCSSHGYSLSLNSHILLSDICIGYLNYNEISDNTLELQRKKLDYTASFNHSDGLIDVSIDSKHRIDEEQSLSDEEKDWINLSTPEVNEAREALKVGPVPRLAILILIVGTRGDVQPFIALGKELLSYGHRVRLATHETFRKFVRENGIEFYPLAGDPADLMSFMVKNAGIVPSVSSIVAGDVGKSRRIIADILKSTWKACIENDDETGVPFVAEAIIANPPSYGHIHCAQKLQIPLHIMFTMPWTPTSAFPHPFCKVNYELGPKESINKLSYGVIEMLTWSGMHDLINEFREDTLQLPPFRTRDAIQGMTLENVPHTYCWSPSLVPKPADWPDYISVSGFFFLDLANNYQPPEDLLQFLEAGDPPIYIGFGSITGHDAQRILRVVLEALAVTGYRALLSGLAKDNDEVPPNVFKIGNCPHDWLFKHVSAVCHHGGAGTTAAGIRAGKPTIIVPFFGDQFFWGTMIWKSGAGAQPLPGKHLNTEDLAEAFKVVHQWDTREFAKRLQIAFQRENGCEEAVQAFHANLPVNRIMSDVESTFGACYWLKDYSVKISRPVAQVLVTSKMIEESQLGTYATREWNRLPNEDQSIFRMPGIIKHGRKAFNSLFVDTRKRLKDVKSTTNNGLATARDGAGCVLKGVGKSLGHASIGCLSFYGDVTDTLQRLPKLYDPYSDSDAHKQPQVDSIQAGAKAAGNSVWHGFKDGLSGFITKPRAGFQRHGILGGAAGAAVAIPNSVVKPVAGTLASITWLSRGVYAEAKNLVNRNDSSTKENSLGSNSKGHRRALSGPQSHYVDNTPAGMASFESGLTIEKCKEIINKFEQIKNEYDLMLQMNHDTVTKKKEKKYKHIFQRQRSHSAGSH